MPRAARATAKVLVVAENEVRGRTLAHALDFIASRGIDHALHGRLPASCARYRLVVWEGETDPDLLHPLIGELPQACYVVLAPPVLTLEHVAFYLQDDRVCHFLRSPIAADDLGSLAEKLDTGAIFGLERYLPPSASVHYRRVSSFKERCDVLDEIEALVRKERLRSQVRRSAAQVAEELMMNAMYQAPRDDHGNQVFADVEPALRIKRKTPRPVSLRYAAEGGAFFLSVRDRYGSFHRADLWRALRRCLTEEVQLEQKKLGAGLGFYVIASATSRMIINLMPGQVAEFICVLEPRTAAEGTLRELSIATQRPLSDYSGSRSD